MEGFGSRREERGRKDQGGMETMCVQIWEKGEERQTRRRRKRWKADEQLLDS